MSTSKAQRYHSAAADYEARAAVALYRAVDLSHGPDEAAAEAQAARAERLQQAADRARHLAVLAERGTAS